MFDLWLALEIDQRVLEHFQRLVQTSLPEGCYG